jgi:hypothetical protein
MHYSVVQTPRVARKAGGPAARCPDGSEGTRPAGLGRPRHAYGVTVSTRCTGVLSLVAVMVTWVGWST